MVDTLYGERAGQLTSDKLATWGEADWRKGAGVEEEDWVRTEIMVLELWGKREGR